jgi:RNA polymerase sigma-70 factor (ECF subfamily)
MAAVELGFISAPHEDGTNGPPSFPLVRNRCLPVDTRGEGMRRDLVDRARGGDRDAFATLAADSIGRLFNIAQLMLRDGDRADDAVQETLVLAWRDLKGLRDPDGFDAWLHRVLVRCVYREANRERRQSAGAVQVRDIQSSPDSSRDVEDRDALERGFRRLRPEQRAVLVLHHYLGFSEAEAADALSVPVGTIKSRLNRATSALRAELEADARTADRLAMEVVR